MAIILVVEKNGYSVTSLNGYSRFFLFLGRHVQSKKKQLFWQISP